MSGQVKPEDCLSVGQVGTLGSDLCLQWNKQVSEVIST